MKGLNPDLCTPPGVGLDVLLQQEVAAKACESPNHVWDRTRRWWTLKCPDCRVWLTVDSERPVRLMEASHEEAQGQEVLTATQARDAIQAKVDGWCGQDIEPEVDTLIAAVREETAGRYLDALARIEALVASDAAHIVDEVKAVIYSILDQRTGDEPV